MNVNVPAMERRRWTSRVFSVVLFMTYTLALTDGIKLIGINNCAGRVELSNGSRVCGDSWGLQEARVVCKALICAKPVAVGPFSSVSGAIYLKDVKCSGSESNLTQCRHNGYGPKTCQSDAGVVCSGGFANPSVSTNTSEVHWGGSISIKCDISKEIHQLTKGRFKLTKNTEVQEPTGSSASETFTVSDVKFEDGKLLECCYEVKIEKHSLCSNVSFRVTVDLQLAPTISASPDQQQWSTGGIQVTRGYGFVINCSTSTLSPEGQFFLWFSGSNSSVSAHSVNRSASFYFNVSKSEDQGQYSCVYQVTEAGRTYTSPRSEPFMVTITQPLLPIILPVVAVSLLLLVLFGLYFLYRRRRRRGSTHITNVTTSAPAPLSAMNQYEDSDDEEEADYVNAPDGGQDKDSDEDSDEPDYVNVTVVNENDFVDIYGGDDENIYQNC